MDKVFWKSGVSRIDLKVKIGLLSCFILLTNSVVRDVTAEWPVASSPAYETTPRLGNDGASILVTYTSRVLIPDDGFDQADIWYQRLYSSGAPMGTPVQVTADPTDDQLNDISGDYIVYTGYQSTTSMTGRIMLHQISTGAVYVLGSALVMQESRIHGNNVVWREGASAHGQVMYYNLSWIGTDTTPEVLAGPEPPTYCVDIGERFVVWSERIGTEYDVVAYDFLTQSRVQITSTSGLHETEPSTCGTWIAWQEQTVGVPSAPIRILARNMETAEERVVADNGAQNYRPSIDGDAICYESEINGNLDAFYYQLSTDQTSQVTSNEEDQYLNDVFGNLVAYVDRRNGNDDIFIESLPPPPTVNWWPMFRRGLNHKGYSTSMAPSDNSTTWSHATGGPVLSSPAVLYGKLYVGSYDKKIHCLDSSTGAEVWAFTTGGGVQSSPMVIGDRVYAGSHDNKLYCLDALTGIHIWNYTTDGDVLSSPTIWEYGGRVYVGSMDRKLYCIDASSGTHIWNYTTEGSICSSPIMVGWNIYVGSADCKIYCLYEPSSTHIWNYTTGGPVYSSPAAAYNHIYMGSYDHKIYCLNASNGAHIWNYTTGGAVFSSPAIAYGKVYVGSMDDMSVHCLNAGTGAHVWNYTTGGEVQSSPAVAEGKVYVGSNDNKLYCLNASTGALIWAHTSVGSVFSSPAVADGRVYVGSHDTKVYAFGLTHDVALTAIEPQKAVVGQSYTCPINVTVTNEGEFTETFDIIAYANARGTENGLSTCWSFDEGTGVTARDSSANNNHGSFASAKAWEWQYTGNLEGWTANQVTDFNSAEDSLNGRTTGTNPNVDSSDNLGIDATQAKTIHIRMKVAQTSTPAKIYFTTVADSVWDATKSKFFDLQNAGQWVEYTINMSSVFGWTGTIKQIRLVPCQLSDVTFNIDWLRVGSNPHWRQGKFGIALDFDGVYDKVSAPFIPLNDHSFTVTAWFNAKSVPVYPVDAPLLSQFDTPALDKYLHLVLRNAYAYFGFYGDDLWGTTTLNTNTWYHIAFVYNYTSNYKYVYLNGALDASGPSLAAYKGISGNTIIGADQGNSFNGTIDEVRIYSRALTQNEIKAVASSGAFQTQTTTLSEGSSTTLTFTWNTTDWIKGYYTISAHAWPVLGETDTVDNTIADGTVIVAMIGDITGPAGWPDSKCDIRDIALIAKYFGQNVPPAPVNCDITGPITGVPDNKIDIRDIATVAKRFGQVDP